MILSYEAPSPSRHRNFPCSSYTEVEGSCSPFFGGNWISGLHWTQQSRMSHEWNRRQSLRYLVFGRITRFIPLVLRLWIHTSVSSRHSLLLVTAHRVVLILAEGALLICEARTKENNHLILSWSCYMLLILFRFICRFQLKQIREILAQVRRHGFLNLRVTELEGPSFVIPGQGEKEVILSLLILPPVSFLLYTYIFNFRRESYIQNIGVCQTENKQHTNIYHSVPSKAKKKNGAKYKGFVGEKAPHVANW